MSELLLRELGVVLVSSVMIICGILSKRDLIRPHLNYLFSLTRSPKFTLFLSLLTLGCLPIHGRLISISPLISPLSSDKRGREKLGVISYLCTHHFYLWSPLEKSVLITMGFLGLAWGEFVWLMIVPLIITLFFTAVIFFWYTRDLIFDCNFGETNRHGSFDLFLLAGIVGVCLLRFWPGYDLVFLLFFYCLYLIARYKVSLKEAFSYLNGSAILVLAISVFFGWYFGTYEAVLQSKVAEAASPYLVASIVFLGSLLLGSSAKYSGLTVIAASAMGIQYLPFFYISGYCGYLLSPAHQCVALGRMYFGTSIREYYLILFFLSICLLVPMLFLI